MPSKEPLLMVSVGCHETDIGGHHHHVLLQPPRQHLRDGGRDRLTVAQEGGDEQVVTSLGASAEAGGSRVTQSVQTSGPASQTGTVN